MDELKVQEKAIEEALKLANLVVKRPLETIGEIFNDQAEFWRFKNKVNIALKTKAYLEKKNITAKELPFKVAYQLFENASLEEEENMQDKWAALLSNLVDTENKTATTQIYIQILNQLTAPEVAILESLFKSERGNRYSWTSDGMEGYKSRGDITREISISENDIYVYSDNLKRLNLVEFYEVKYTEPNVDNEPDKLETGIFINQDFHPFNFYVGDEIRLSDFGLGFVQSCSFKE